MRSRFRQPDEQLPGEVIDNNFISAALRAEVTNRPDRRTLLSVVRCKDVPPVPADKCVICRLWAVGLLRSAEVWGL